MIKRLTDTTTIVIAGFFLFTMLAMGFFSMLRDSLTMDELSHIPAGYSYLVKRDYRINPEHPPLVKDLAALPLLFLKLKFPEESPSWTTNVNDQWGFGPAFLWQSGNDADRIITLARAPMLLLLLVLGYYIFRFARELGGNKGAIVAILLFAFSPEFLAHGRLVTTDVGASLGMFVATYYFLKFLIRPSKRSLAGAGLSLGVALLLKFSTVFLIPYFISLILVRFLIACIHHIREKVGVRSLLAHSLRIIFKDVGSFALIIAIAFLLIWPVYQYHVWNYPASLQKHHTDFLLQDYGGGKEITRTPIGTVLSEEGPLGLIKYINRGTADITVWMADKPLLRPYAEWFLGLLMVMHRSAHGNTTFFLGQVASAGWLLYFPIVYLIKIPLALHILTLLTLVYFIRRVIAKSFTKKFLWEWGDAVEKSFIPFALLVFILFYWLTSLRSNLNIGVRHLLPTLPFLYVLLGMVLSGWLEKTREKWVGNIFQEFRRALEARLSPLVHGLFVGVLLFWYLASTLKAYPAFIPYFNELVGGAKNGYAYVVDSNLDWGQDFKRLLQFIEANNISEIRIHYFGGVDPQYYLGDRYIPWGPERGRPKSGWFALSLTEQQGRQAKPVRNFIQKPEERYDWLIEKPFTIVGSSIAVYKFE